MKIAFLSFSFFICSIGAAIAGPIDSLKVPNVFTPNGDGVNDAFYINGLNVGDVVEIYNRWGSIVYTFISIEDQWDGHTTSGILCSEGVYFYVITSSGQKASGTLQLLK